MGSKKMEAATTRIEPTSPGENTRSPRFIRMNEVPQISDNRISSVRAFALLFSGTDMPACTDFERQRFDNAECIFKPILAYL